MSAFDHRLRRLTDREQALHRRNGWNCLQRRRQVGDRTVCGRAVAYSLTCRVRVGRRCGHRERSVCVQHAARLARRHHIPMPSTPTTSLGGHV